MIIRGVTFVILIHESLLKPIEVGDRKISDTPKFNECGKIPKGKTRTHFEGKFSSIKALPSHACLNQGSKKPVIFYSE